MMGTLIESRRPRQLRLEGSATSIVVHTLVIGAAVFATATSSVSAPVTREVLATVVYTPPPRELPRPTEPSTALPTTTIDAAPPVPTFTAPLVIPTEIPAIDLAATSRTDEIELRRHGAGPVCDFSCPQRLTGSPSAVDVSQWSANDVMMRLIGQPAPPRYPEQLRRAGIDGSVLVKFVVDTLGRIDPASIEILRSTHEAFTIVVRDALLAFRFNPAMAGNRKIPATAVMPFQFTLK